MSRGFVSVIATALVVAALAPGAIGGVAAEDVTLTVTIVDANGNELGNVPVTATWNDGDGGPVNRTTAPNGQALFGVPAGANVQITVTDDRYLRNFPYTVENVTDQSVEVPVSLSGTATVTVEDANGVVEDAKVWLYQDGRYVDTKETGSDGTSTTDALERGGYGLEVRKTGYITNRTDIAIDGSTANKTVQIRRGSAEVSFRVTDDTFAEPRPLENATVNIRGGASLPTLSNGFASTSVAVNREYQVTVSKDGYTSVTRTLQVEERPVNLNVSIRRSEAISVRAANDRVVVGESTQVTVTDEYGEAVAGATVSTGGSEIGTTDANGQLTVPLDTAGNATINVSNGSLSASTTVEVFDPDATPEPTATATATATETATETSAATETPGDSGPGFGVLAALAALAGAILLGRRR
jgi:PGF-CTERM protein